MAKKTDDLEAGVSSNKNNNNNNNNNIQCFNSVLLNDSFAEDVPVM